ncbi:hypothetical protein D9757_004163 [Collybiopsis confluens]|uniref:Uncharacterized protein n=1 Tax=Collybiopsis confluens TaxID=2823264 RepID=A0A8H5HU85_9AGAR|nr:hypothetical protein D9757_004163 [Collybiopsis confluens]
MTVSFSLTSASTGSDSVCEFEDNFPVYNGQRLCGDLAQEHLLPPDMDLPPRPESRLDFVRGPSSYEMQPKSRSHSRAPSATFRWTRDILRKIRLSASGSPSSAIHAPPHSSIIDCVSTIDVTASMSTSLAPVAEEGSSDVALSWNLDTDPSVSDSSSLFLSSSTFSTSRHPFDSINVSSSSDLQGSSEDSDSDSDLDSLKEIDLGDGLLDEGNEDETCVPAFSFSHAHTPIINAAPATPSLLPPVTLSDSLPSVNHRSEHKPLDYAIPQKHACVPSPLSMCTPSVPYNSSDFLEPSMKHVLPDSQPYRHLYPHRGHSKHALHYRKWFWTLREGDWTRYAEWMDQYCAQKEAYAGMSTSPDPGDARSSLSNDEEIEEGSSSLNSPNDLHKLFPSLFSRARDTVPNASQHRAQNAECHSLMDGTVPSAIPPMSIHPRWGDLLNIGLSRYNSAAARSDTWCMHTDRFLLVGLSLGLWTVRKVLWLSELNRLRGQTRSMDEEEGEQTFVEDDIKGTCHVYSVDDEDDDSSFGESEDDDSEEGEIMHSSVVSLTSVISASESVYTSDSDDSDTTLVESDSDSEARVASSSSVVYDNMNPSRRSFDFEGGGCSSDHGGEDFEEVDLGSGSGRDSTSALTSHSLGGEPKTLFQALYRDATARTCTPRPIAPSKNYLPETSKEGKMIHSWRTRSWYEQCELLLTLTGPKATAR